MKYLIQQNFVREENIDKLIDLCTETNREFEIIPVYYNLDIITTFQPNEYVFIFGGYHLANKAKEYNWQPGSLMNDKHDFIYYKDIYKEHLLNYNSVICNIFDSIEWNNKLLFIRPCVDSKVFSGKVFSEYEFVELQTTLKERTGNATVIDSQIQVNQVVNIQQEIRFWIVGNLIVDACTYKLNGIAQFNKIIEPSAFVFVNEMLKLPQIASSFVMDIALVNNEYKIVELNCINASGFYLCDIFKLVEAIETYYNK